MTEYSRSLARAIAAMTGSQERTATIVRLASAPKRPRPVSEILDIADAFVPGHYVSADHNADHARD